MRRRRQATVLAWLGGVLLGGLAWLLVSSLGLDQADKLASVVAAMVALVTFFLTRRGAPDSTDAPSSTADVVPANATPHDMYIDAFLHTNRCPEWNQELCSTQQLESVGLHYTPVHDDRPPAFIEYLYKLERGMLKSRRESLRQVTSRLLDSDHGKVTVLLGDPGAGKSSFAVQLVHLVAQQYRKPATATLPVYVNLAHFDSRYAATPDGLTEHIADVMSQACPRHRMRRGGAKHLRNLGERLLTGPAPTEVLLVLDGMDEMPNRDYVDRVRAVAGFMDDVARQHFTFVVTCRYADFIQLRDHTNNLRLQRWDLLPWTRQMARNYLRVRGRSQTLGEDSGDDKGSPPRRQFYDPLEIALRAEVDKPAAETGIHEIWDSYLRHRLAMEFPSVDAAILELSRFAYEQTWHSSWQPSLPVLEAARRAGLLRGLTFEIRPLMHHLAGKELWRRIDDTGVLPADVRLDDINVREAVKSAGIHAGTSPRWAAAVTAALSAPGGKRTRGDRLSVAAHVLAPSHIASSEELRRRLVEVIATQVASDDVERIRCLEALSRQPALLDPELPSTAELFAWIAEHGSSGAVSWLLELFARNGTVRRQHRPVLLRTLGRVLDRGQLAWHVQSLLARLLSDVRWLRPAVSTTRITLLGLGFYVSYLVAWTAAFLVLLPIHHGLETGWVEDAGVVGLWLSGHGIIVVIGCVWTARALLPPRDDDGVHRWLIRFPTFLAIMFGVRLLWGLFQVLSTMPPAKWMARSAVLLIALPFLVVVAVIVYRQWSSRPRAANADDDDADRWHIYISFAAVGGIALALLLGELGLGLLVGAAGVGLVAVETLLLRPLRNVRRRKRRIRTLMRENLSADLDVAVTEILADIADEDVPTWARIAYVDVLAEVHFTDDLRHRLEALYASLPPGPVLDRLTGTVLRAHHEHCKERSSGPN